MFLEVIMFFAISLLLHFLVAGAITLPPKPTPATSSSGVEKQEKEGELQGTEAPTPIKVVLIPKGSGAKKQCSNSYTGIGIVHVFYSTVGEIVTQVPEGYPAFRAGIKTGDVILNAWELKGPEGTKVTVRTKRTNKNINYQITRETICQFQ